MYLSELDVTFFSRWNIDLFAVKHGGDTILNPIEKCLPEQGQRL